MSSHEGPTFVKFPCFIGNCQSTFAHLRSLKKHLSLYHEEHVHTPSKRAKRAITDCLEYDFQFKCPHLSCGHAIVETMRDVKTHLVQHVQQEEKVSCPFKGCLKAYDKRSSLQNHFDRAHEGQHMSMLKQHVDQLLHSNRVPYSTVEFIVKKYLAAYTLSQKQKTEAIIQTMKKNDCPEELITELN
jgi:hypothetical protein